ncbi:MAG TPA: TetR/AcrR family transcriptional regulator [Amycolatopsis sp.]|nr:TetR/AcrR family transcriptional regulator [Amycolatopsis sp.]
MTTDNDETNLRILAAARRQFNNPGYHHARVADIAKDSGVSRATVYNRFADKEELLTRLVEDFLAGYARIGERMDAAIEHGESMFAVLLRMVEDALMWRVSNADLRPAIEIARQILPEAFTRANRAADEVLSARLAKVHRAGRTIGIVRPDIDVDYAASAVYAMIDSTLSTTDVGSSEHEIKRAALQLTLLQWYAVYTISPEESPRLES